MSQEDPPPIAQQITDIPPPPAILPSPLELQPVRTVAAGTAASPVMEPEPQAVAAEPATGEQGAQR